MSEEYGGDIITITDDDGNSYELEHLDTIELDGTFYLAFLPVDMDENNPDYGMVILREETEGDEAFLAQPEDDELEKVYELFMERLFPEDGEAEEEDGEE